MALPFTWSEWRRLDAIALADHIRSGRTTSVEVAAQAAAAIEMLNPALQAVLEVFYDAVEDPSREIPTTGGALYGVPMLMKDSGSGMRGRLREWGSRLSTGQRAAADCPVTTNLRQAGINLLGRTTLPENGKTFDTTADYRGSLVVTRNPWNPAKTPGVPRAVAPPWSRRPQCLSRVLAMRPVLPAFPRRLRAWWGISPAGDSCRPRAERTSSRTIESKRVCSPGPCGIKPPPWTS